MIREPGDRLPATPDGHDHLRASDADRERAIDILQGAFASGQLTRGEFDTRMGQALGARTYAELATLTALTFGTGAGLTGSPQARTPSVAPARIPARSCASVIMAALRRTGRLLAGSDVSGEAETRVAGFPSTHRGASASSATRLARHPTPARCEATRVRGCPDRPYVRRGSSA